MNFNCAFCLVYGAHTREEKRVVWEELSYIVSLCQVPFCLLEDFNEILQVEDRKGLNSLLAAAEESKEWVQDMQLIDLPFSDRKFTWFRGDNSDNACVLYWAVPGTMKGLFESWTGMHSRKWLNEFFAVI
ncbi:hypothetical protein AHAS_Ahas20G0049000 [Arachis hypogaea]